MAYGIRKTRSFFRPLSGIQFSLLDEGCDPYEALTFPSPLGDSILITNRMKADGRRVTTVSVPSRGFNSHYWYGRDAKSPSIWVSVPSRGFNSHYKCPIIIGGDSLSFRPLSGIQFSLPQSVITLWDMRTIGFRPLSGIQFSLPHYPNTIRAIIGTEFPSPLGDSILITAGRRAAQYAVDRVSVPSRGFNSHYWRMEGVMTKTENLFPSPLGDSILITNRRKTWKR